MKILIRAMKEKVRWLDWGAGGWKEENCYRLKFFNLPQFLYWNPIPNGIVLGGEAFRVISHEGGALMDDIKCLFILFLYLCPSKRGFGEPPASSTMCEVCLVVQSCPALCDPMHCSPPGSSWGFFRQEYWSGLPCPPHGSSQPRDRTQVFNPGLPHCRQILYCWAKASACSAGDPGSTPGLGSSPGEGNGNLSSTLA